MSVEWKSKLLYYFVLKSFAFPLFVASYVVEIMSFNQSRSRVESIAYDWYGKNIYYTDNGLKQIGVVRAYPLSSMPEMKISKVLFTERLGRPRAIVVHPAAGCVYL